MLIGSEQIYNPSYSPIEKAYIALFGMPIIGLRIRSRNIFALIPTGRQYPSILDAGSGTGVLSFQLGKRFPDAQVTGVDLLDDAIRDCNQIAKKIKAANVKFRQASIERLPEQNAFNLIICVDIMEHIENDLAALRGLYHASAPGGIMVLHVPSLYRRYPVWKKHLNFDVVSHVRIGYEPEDIRTLVRQSGFTIGESGFTYGFWETLANNLSYMITHVRLENKMLYALAFPWLNLISLIGIRARPEKLGAGIFIVAKKS